MDEGFSQKYRLGERIGAGGMAEVFRAHIVGAAGFEREIAVKRIRPELASNPAFVEMFIREASLAARLVHPNIVQVFDFDNAGGTYFIAMEFVRGWDLRTIEYEAQKGGVRLPLDVGLGIVINVLDGLSHAHGLRGDDGKPLGIIHRDVSPHNVLVSPLGDVKLTDFGIARASFAAGETESGARKGKLVYMAPEQVEGKSVDHRSDIFSSGVMLFEMLAGQRPFDAESDFAIMSRIVRAEMPALPPEVPPPLGAIVRKALAQKAEARYQSAAQLRDALRNFTEHHNLDIGKLVRRDYLTGLFGERADALVRAPSQMEVSARKGGGASVAGPALGGQVVTIAGKLGGAGHAASGQRSLGGASAGGRSAGAATAIPDGASGRRPRRRVVAALAAAGVLLGFASTGLVLRLRPTPTLRVMVRMADAHLRWFERQVVAPFAAREGVKIQVQTFPEVEALIDELERARHSGQPPDLVWVPLLGARVLAEGGYVAPIAEVAERAGVSPDALAALRAQFDDGALAAGEYTTVTGRALYYLPHRLESRLLVYRPSRVRDAVRRWREQRAALDGELLALGLQGLPAGYELEDDPARWDLFDVLMAGYLWSHDGSGAGGRIGRRSHTLKYFGAVAELLDLAAALGAQPADLTSVSEPLVDAFEWEAVRRALGIYHRSVFDEERGASGSTIVEAIGRGEVDLALLSQKDALLLHGNRDLGLAGKLASTDDLDVAPAPEGVSLRLNADGAPLRRGGRRGLLEGWLWGIPRGALQPSWAWRLAVYVSSHRVQQDESNLFLTTSVRRDRGPPPSPFGRRVYDASSQQDRASALLFVPRFDDLKRYEHYRDGMLAAWDDLVVRQQARGPDGSGPIDRAAIRRLLVPAVSAR